MADGADYGVGDADEETVERMGHVLDIKARRSLLDREEKIIEFHRPLMDKLVDGVKTKEIKGFDIEISGQGLSMEDFNTDDSKQHESEGDLLVVESITRRGDESSEPSLPVGQEENPVVVEENTVPEAEEKTDSGLHGVDLAGEDGSEELNSNGEHTGHHASAGDTVEIVCSSSSFRGRSKHFVLNETDGNHHAFSMETYRLERSIRMERVVLQKSPFFATRLASEWDDIVQVRFVAPRPITVRALQCVLEYLVTGSISHDEKSVFEILAVAKQLGVDSVVEELFPALEKCVGRTTIIAATHFALLFELDGLLQRCYSWIIENLIETGMLGRVIWDKLEASKEGSTYRDVTIKQGSYSLPLIKLEPIVSKTLATRKKYCSVFPDEVFTGHLIRHKDLSSVGVDTYALYASKDPETPLLTAKYYKASEEYLITCNPNPNSVRPHTPETVGSVK